MARGANSNILRVGFNLSWFGSFSLPHNLFIFNYIPRFLEDLFIKDVDEAFYGPGPVRVRYVNKKFFVIIDIYDFRYYPKLRFRVNRKRNLIRHSIIWAKNLDVRILKQYLQELLTLEISKFFAKTAVLFRFKRLFMVDADFIFNYFKLRTSQDFTVMQTVRAVHKLLRRRKKILGYKIIISGRFGRQQRAKSITIKKGRVVLCTFSKTITYVENYLILKHGKCGFKVWFYRLPSKKKVKVL